MTVNTTLTLIGRTKELFLEDMHKHGEELKKIVSSLFYDK